MKMRTRRRDLMTRTTPRQMSKESCSRRASTSMNQVSASLMQRRSKHNVQILNRISTPQATSLRVV